MAVNPEKSNGIWFPMILTLCLLFLYILNIVEIYDNNAKLDIYKDYRK